MTTAIESFNQIVAEPIATIRKFKLMKVFHAILPADAKELSADEIAAIIHKKLAA
jgi:hypothetical protein